VPLFCGSAWGIGFRCLVVEVKVEVEVECFDLQLAAIMHQSKMKVPLCADVFYRDREGFRVGPSHSASLATGSQHLALGCHLQFSVFNHSPAK